MIYSTELDAFVSITLKEKYNGKCFWALISSVYHQEGGNWAIRKTL